MRFVYDAHVLIWLAGDPTTVEFGTYMMMTLTNLLICESRFCINPSLEDLTLKILFFVGLAVGIRVSELHSLRSDRNYFVFW